MKQTEAGGVSRASNLPAYCSYHRKAADLHEWDGTLSSPLMGLFLEVFVSYLTPSHNG